MNTKYWSILSADASGTPVACETSTNTGRKHVLSGVEYNVVEHNVNPDDRRAIITFRY